MDDSDVNQNLNSEVPDTTQSDADTEDKLEQIGPELFRRRPKGSKYIIEYHRDLCIGVAVCTAIAPNTFEMDDENKAVLIKTPELDPDEVILAAAQSCPALAIIIKDAATGEQIFPPVENAEALAAEAA
jgi:ferredoxin